MKQVIFVILILALLCLIGVAYLQTRKEGFDIPITIPASLESALNGNPVSYFPRILTEQAKEPDNQQIIDKFVSCMQSGDTVKGCLTVSGAGLRPGLCQSLCATQYGDMGKYCTTVCTDQQNQIITSARNGPA